MAAPIASARFGFYRDNAPWLVAGALLTFSSSYGQTFFISIFAGEIRAEFGLSHAGWGAIYSIGTLASAAAMIWAGTLADRMSVRALGSWVMVLLACACLAMAAVPSAWALVPVIFALRFAGQGMPGHIATVAMVRWFVATRGQALAVAVMGFSLGEAVLPLIFVAALTVAPWRSLWGVAALLALAAIPLLRILLRRERVPRGQDRDDTGQAGMSGRHWTRAQALRHPLFWCILPHTLGPPTFVTALFFQQVHLAEVKGWRHFDFVALFPLYTGMAVLATLVSGAALDRIGARRLMPVSQLPLIGGFVCLGLLPDLSGAAAGMALVALTVGVSHTLPAAFWADLFGTRHIGAIRALLAAFMVLATALGPLLTGALIDAGVTFDRQLPWLTLWFAGSTAVLFLALRAYRADLSAMA